MNWKVPIRVVMRKLHARKLLTGVKTIGNASLDDLRNPEFVADLIRSVGLRYDRRRLYGSDNGHMNLFGPGLWQIPEQLAGALVFLSQQSLTSVLEIGTCDGWTSSVMAAYLHRFQPGLRFVTIDIDGRYETHPRVNRLVPIEYCGKGTVDNYQDQDFDLVFIDGNHDYEWVKYDYDLAGRKARVTMFHDIVDELRVGAENVPKFWKDLKAMEADESEFVEFTGGPAGVMGIGVRAKRAILDSKF